MQEKREKRGRDGVNKHAMVNQFTRKAQQNERQWLVHALPVLDFQWILFHLQVHTQPNNKYVQSGSGSALLPCKPRQARTTQEEGGALPPETGIQKTRVEQP